MKRLSIRQQIIKSRLKRFEMEKEEQIIHQWSMLVIKVGAILLGLVVFYKFA